MLNLFKKKTPPSTTNIVIPGSDPESRAIKLSNLDCPSCAIDLDLTLEELPGVTSAKTNYAKSEINISFDPKKITLQKIKSAIKSAGY